MTLFFPDLNVWLALSDRTHVHNASAWDWFNLVPGDARLVFSRYTQIGLLRLLTNQSVMGPETMTLRQAWHAYDDWRNDPRVEFYPEPLGMEAAFREATAPHETKPASKWIGDCYLLAYAKECRAVLATFDRALFEFGRKRGYPVIIP
jgi:toxin-antitoxin system PIN domain toxin